MKRLSLLFALALLSFSLFAKAGFGYSIAPFGESAADKEDFFALSTSLIFTPNLEHHIGDIEADVALSYTKPYFNGVKLKVSSPVFVLKNHPFNFLFPNSVLWAPKVSVGGEYRMDKDLALYFSLSPLAFFDTEFSYEFFTPFGLYDFDRKEFGWGMYIMRFSVYFGGKR